jgi:hypothetical protein
MVDRLLRLACRMAVLSATCLSPLSAPAQSAPANANAPDAIPLKPARTEFNLDEISPLINNVLLVPPPGGPLPTGGRNLQVVQGRVLDAAGAPVFAAHVALTGGTNYGRDFDDNYDKTDRLGRFLVRGNDRRRRLVVRSADGQIMRTQLEPGQAFALVQWPGLRKLNVHVAPELCAPGTKINLSCQKSETGLQAPRREATLDDAGKATFDHVPPTNIRIFATIQLKRDNGKSDYHYRVIGAGTLAAASDAEQTLELTTAGRIPVRGDVGPDALNVIINRVETAAFPWAGPADAVLVNPDGTFLAHVPGPGDYRLVVHAKPVRRPDGKPIKSFEDIPPGARIYLNGEITTRRFTVGLATQRVDIPRDEPHKHPTIARMHNLLDSRMGGHGASRVSYSFTDVKGVDLTRIDDRAGVVAELLRILNDPHAPTNWKYLALGALGRIVDSPGVADGLIALLKSRPADIDEGQIFDALEQAKQDLPRIVDVIAPYTSHELGGFRRIAYGALARLAYVNPQLRERVAPVLIAGLHDPDDLVRSRLVRLVNNVVNDTTSEAAAVAELKTLTADPHPDISIWAAQALWKITGDSTRLIPMATALLMANDDDYEAKGMAAYVLDGVPSLPPATLDALRRFASFKRTQGHPNHIEGSRAQLAYAAQKILKAHGITPTNDPPDTISPPPPAANEGLPDLSELPAEDGKQ